SIMDMWLLLFFSSRRRHTRSKRDWSSDVCSSDLVSETDLLGHVNHANYFTFMEEGRLSFLKGMGLQVEDQGFSIMLASAKCDFIRQGYFHQTLIVNT